MRAGPPVQRKSTRSQKVTGNVGGEERFDVIIVGESKNKKVGPLPRRFLSAGEWENGLVELRSGVLRNGLVVWLRRVLATRDECTLG
jgi:hypothetical protein